MDGQVDDLLLQPDGKIVVSGMFSHIIDGSGTRRAAPSPGSPPTACWITPLPRVLPCPPAPIPSSSPPWPGSPTARSSSRRISLITLVHNCNYISTQVARLNSNGSLDPSFTLGTPADGWFYPGGGNSILRLPNGKALIGGNFSQLQRHPGLVAGPDLRRPGEF